MSEPTHQLGGTLDVIIAGVAANKPQDVTVTDIGLSDHMMIAWFACPTPSVPIFTTKTKISWKNLNIESIRTRLSDSALCKSDQYDDVIADVDTLADQYDNIITDILDELAPVTEFTVRNRTHHPWFDGELRLTRRVVRRFERQFKRHRRHRRHTMLGETRFMIRGNNRMRRLETTGKNDFEFQQQSWSDVTNCKHLAWL